jgi:hypothetical protein
MKDYMALLQRIGSVSRKQTSHDPPAARKCIDLNLYLPQLVEHWPVYQRVAAKTDALSIYYTDFLQNESID